MKSRLCATLVLMLLATGCATKGLRSEFDDVPVPRGMTYQPDRSVVIESPTIKAGELVYRGRLEPESLGLAMRTLLESNGWRHVNTTTSAKDGTRQVYEKGGNALQVRVYEGLRSEEHTSELQSPCNLVCRLLLEKKKNQRLPDTIFSIIV